MAYKDGNKVTVGTGTWYTRLIVTANEGATSTQFACELRIYGNYEMYVHYNTASIKAGSSSGGSQYGSWTDEDHYLSYPSWSTEYVTVKTWTVTVAKGNAAKTVYFTGSYRLVAMLAGTSTASLAMTVPALVADAPTSCTNTRVSDTRNDVSWTRGANADASYASQRIERRIDGGAWSEIASVGASATSYADTGTSANHSYAYRVRAYNTTGYTAYAESLATHNTPAAPTSIAASRTGETGVLLEIANPANTATALEIQQSSDGSSWGDSTSYEGKVTTVAVNPGGGTFYFRARNTRDDLASDWSPASNAVVTVTPPAAPTLVAPVSGAVIDSSSESIALQWAHNPIDGSAQTAAEARWSTDGGETWYALAVDGAAQSAEIETPAANTEVVWQVRTKGAHADYGAWSATRTFSVKSAPVVVIEEPESGFVLERMPLEVRLSYDDLSGSLVSATLTVERDGATVYTREMGSSTEASIRASDWLPENHASYTVRVSVRSSSTLTASALRELQVEFVPPAEVDADISYDEATGYASIVVGSAPSEGVPVVSISVYRVVGESRKLLGDGLSAGAEVIDRNAPVNVPYAYEVVAFAESGAYSANTIPALLESPWFYFYGKNVDAKAKWNPSGQVKPSRPNKRRVSYAGRELPVSYDTPNFADERSVSLLVRTKDEADAFYALMREGGRCVYKSGDGDVIYADIDVSVKQSFQSATYYGTVSVTLHRIDGEEL